MNESKHDPKLFPLPWKYFSDGDGATIMDADGWHIATMEEAINQPDSVIDALGEQIVRAVNSHQALIEALGVLLAGVGRYLDGDGDEEKLKEACRVASEARRQAKC